MRFGLIMLGILTVGFSAVLFLERCPLRESQRGKTEEDIGQCFPETRLEGEPTCVICLGAIEADEAGRVTQCGHSFHAGCLLSWWIHERRKVFRCPNCRTRQQMQSKKSKVWSVPGRRNAAPGFAKPMPREELHLEDGQAEDEREHGSRRMDTSSGQLVHCEGTEDGGRAVGSTGQMAVKELEAPPHCLSTAMAEPSTVGKVAADLPDNKGEFLPAEGALAQTRDEQLQVAHALQMPQLPSEEPLSS